MIRADGLYLLGRSVPTKGGSSFGKGQKNNEIKMGEIPHNDVTDAQ